MKNYTYQLLWDAKKSNNKEKMKSIYEGNKTDTYIKLEYAKFLLNDGNIKEGEKLLLELLETSNYLYALVELGKLETEKGNYDKAKEYFSEVLKYGNKKDKNIALFWFAEIEADLGNFDKAKGYLNKAYNNGSEEDKMFSRLESGRIAFRQKEYTKAKIIFTKLLNRKNKTAVAYGIRSLLILNTKTNNLKEALKNINFAIKNNIDIDYINILYISKELNIFFNTEYKNSFGYQDEQVILYDPYYAIDHIMYRHGEDEIYKKSVKFSNKVDALKLFVDIKNNLKEEYKLNRFVFNDIYVIKYEGVGAEGQNYLKVVTLPNSKEIMSMYPIYNNEHDLEYGQYDLEERLMRKK